MSTPRPTPDPPEAPAPTLAECLGEIRRELTVRRAVYPKWVESGRLDHAEAQYRARCMRQAGIYLAALNHCKLKRACCEGFE